MNNLFIFIVTRIIGEDKALFIKFGAEAGDPSTEDIIWLCGISSEVDRAVERIHQIVECAKEDAIASSYVWILHYHFSWLQSEVFAVYGF